MTLRHKNRVLYIAEVGYNHIYSGYYATKDIDRRGSNDYYSVKRRNGKPDVPVRLI